MMSTRRQIRQTVPFDLWNLDGKLVDVIQSLQKALDGIPEDYRESASIDVGVSDCGVEIEIEYFRPETDAELETRLQRHALAEQQQAEKERAEYERLKAKFG